jgi:hypothetical protein
MTSRKEPFGMVTIEAMSMGCVPVAYDIPSGSTEIIENGKSGLLVPLGHTRAWAEHIRDLHHNRQRLAELSVGAMERARTAFNADVMAENLVAFLREVMTNAQDHPAHREAGLPPVEPAVHGRAARGYQRLPSGLRQWIRNQIGARPRLCHWWLNQ